MNDWTGASTRSAVTRISGAVTNVSTVITVHTMRSAGNPTARCKTNQGTRMNPALNSVARTTMRHARPVITSGFFALGDPRNNARDLFARHHFTNRSRL